jgi:NAD(P)-dependent dehydrogenase (short-subunit alcohol dehydrogenase family)
LDFSIMASISPLDAPQFIAIKTEQEISRRLREDETLIYERKPCSWVAWHLPGYDTEKGSTIAAHLAPTPNLGHDIKRMIYENLVDKIRRHLKDRGSNMTLNGVTREMEAAQKALLPSELCTALKVIAHLQDTAVIQRDTKAETLMLLLEERLDPSSHSSPNASPRLPNIPQPPPLPRKRLCYICRLGITNPDPTHPSMCIPCGAFNHSSSSISTPPRLILSPTFTALVTGARINLGYHIALRLLRCGASVIATTRYPQDAVTRYLDEPDATEWKERLRVVGADFRSSRDAFDLARETKRCLQEWANGGEAMLYALINNAAQTLTDSVKKEERAIKRESALRKQIEGKELLIKGAYRARVRGTAVPLALEDATDFPTTIEHPPEQSKATGTVNVLKDDSTDLTPYTKSSWVQTLPEIPYEDLMTAHSVNTFVPFILCRELLPLMGSTNHSSPSTSTISSKPQGYIINVSSREGIFESTTSSPSKHGKHVHTNMSKAALNMLTETEAEPAWTNRRVTMNTVDPGYMSAAPECEDAYEGVRPIGWEDGAGRVLWPIAVAEIEGMVVRGRFLKHFGAVEVDPGVGRG